MFFFVLLNEINVLDYISIYNIYSFIQRVTLTRWKNIFIKSAAWRRMHNSCFTSWIKIDQLDVTLLYYFTIYCSTCFKCKYIHLQELETYSAFISWVVLLWFDVCWCYGVVRLGWCGILMQAEACFIIYCSTCFEC